MSSFSWMAITRLTRAYNLISSSSGKTLSGGLDPTAIRGPKRVIGAARNMVEGGSLTITRQRSSRQAAVWTRSSTRNSRVPATWSSF